jgi:hypothetical protein
MTVLRFAAVGSMAGAIAALPLAIVTHFLLNMPNAERAGEDLTEFLGLLGTLVVILIVVAYKRCWRDLARRGKPVKIGLLKAIFIGFVVATITLVAYAVSEEYVYHEITEHALLWLVIIVSTVLSLWTTMPKGLREVVGLLQAAEVVEEI